MGSELQRNIELKAQCTDLERARSAIVQLGARDAGVQHQIDTYFNVLQGRLKLREINGERAELIWYERSDQAAARDSRYRIVQVSNPQELAAVLTDACGVRGRVIKRRHVYLYHNVRIHLDVVEKLGTFVELEAVMTPGEEDGAARRRLEQLTRAIGIRDGDLCSGSYSDLLGI